MKNKINILAFALLCFCISSCSKEDAGPINTSDLNTNLQSGKWKISLFVEEGDDETSHFTGYEFQFNSGGTVTATLGGGTMNGAWSTGNDDGQVKLNLVFGILDSPVNELNDDWHVTEQSATFIKMEDISGGSGDEHYLTFSKI